MDAAHDPQTRARLSVGFILAHRFTLSAFANFVDVLRLAADEGDRSRPILCSWRVLSADMDRVASSCGVSVQPDERLGDPRRFDYVVVVGGLIDASATLAPAYMRYLGRAAEAGVPLVGVCTGAFILCRAQLMKGYRCCVSWFHHDDFLEQFNGMQPVADQIFVVDRDRLTCSGGVSSAHLAAYLVDRHVGRAQAGKSLRIMIIENAMSAENPQPGLPLELTTPDALVKRALLLMQQSMEAPLSVGRLALRLGIGRRKLERHFRDALNLTPAQADKVVRIEHAKLLLTSSGRSITQIANDAGFCDVSHFIRVFRQREGGTPEAYRKRVRAMPEPSHA
ncbi:MAG: GlxA family transcriptional regulator [Solirubrobacteraceae bacterium]